MININEINLANLCVIDSYGVDFFRVNGTIIKGDILIIGHKVECWDIKNADNILKNMSPHIDFLLYGSAHNTFFPPTHLMQKLDDFEIRFEAMSTPCACRTYNILLSEGRRVGALLTALSEKRDDQSKTAILNNHA